MDLVLRNCTIVDGTGRPRFGGDVAVQGGRIEAVGHVDAACGREEVDLEGGVLAPGFIDVHTHYDAQVLWDPDLTPSSLHGITTVVMGNCGFGIAPTRPADRSTITRTLENVEGMSAKALDAGIRWDFETFPEYLDVIETVGTRLNVAVLLGHTPLRQYVLGDESADRPATEEEIAAMRTALQEAMDAGAVGFATSRASNHWGVDGKPVPSRLASAPEVAGIAAALKRAGRGIIAGVPGPGMMLDDFAGLSRSIGRPVTTGLLVDRRKPGRTLELLDRMSNLEFDVWFQVLCRPFVTQVTLADPGNLTRFPAFKEALTIPRRQWLQLYRDEGWIERARGQVETVYGSRWECITVEETATHTDLLGCSLAELSQEWDVPPFDVMVSLSLDDELATRFRMVLLNDDEAELEELLRDRRTILGLSDAGAHLSHQCDACFPSYLLSHWVRDRKVLSLEEAVWRLTGQPAEVYGLGQRGLIRPGFAADLVAFDPTTIADTPARRLHDLPSGAERLVIGSTGIAHTWVRGVAVRRDGRDLPGARPGRVLR